MNAALKYFISIVDKTTVIFLSLAYQSDRCSLNFIGGQNESRTAGRVRMVLADKCEYLEISSKAGEVQLHLMSPNTPLPSPTFAW